MGSSLAPQRKGVAAGWKGFASKEGKSLWATWRGVGATGASSLFAMPFPRLASSWAPLSPPHPLSPLGSFFFLKSLLQPGKFQARFWMTSQNFILRSPAMSHCGRQPVPQGTSEPTVAAFPRKFRPRCCGEEADDLREGALGLLGKHTQKKKKKKGTVGRPYQ